MYPLVLLNGVFPIGFSLPNYVFHPCELMKSQFPFSFFAKSAKEPQQKRQGKGK
jgi:hypothetical protein